MGHFSATAPHLNESISFVREGDEQPSCLRAAGHRGRLGIREEAYQKRRESQMLISVTVPVGPLKQQIATLEVLLERAPRLRWGDVPDEVAERIWEGFFLCGAVVGQVGDYYWMADGV
jgi:hypothetical protein